LLQPCVAARSHHRPLMCSALASSGILLPLRPSSLQHTLPLPKLQHTLPLPKLKQNKSMMPDVRVVAKTKARLAPIVSRRRGRLFRMMAVARRLRERETKAMTIWAAVSVALAPALPFFSALALPANSWEVYPQRLTPCWRSRRRSQFCHAHHNSRAINCSRCIITAAYRTRSHGDAIECTT
jgi:hypothetical protein